MMVTVDSIVKSFLLRREYPMHYYLTCLKHAADCVRQLRVHSIGVVKTTVATVNEYGAIDVPEDMESIIRIGWQNGQHIVPLVPGKGGFNRAIHRDSAGQPERFGPPRQRTFMGSQWLSGWFQTWNQLGENTHGWLGYGAGYERDLYQYIQERNQIIFSEELIGLTVVIDYVPDINSCDNLSLIPAYTQTCIEAYIMWQLKKNSRNYSLQESDYEKQEYNKQLKIARSQKFNLGTEEILRAFRRGYHSAIKS